MLRAKLIFYVWHGINGWMLQPPGHAPTGGPKQAWGPYKTPTSAIAQVNKFYPNSKVEIKFEKPQDRKTEKGN